MRVTSVDYIGMRRQMDCGEWATIIEYNQYTDITVKFDTGEIREHVSVSNFLSGKVAKKPRSITLGSVRKMRCDLNAKVIKVYDDLKLVDIEFETGEVISKVPIRRFTSGDISTRTGELAERRLNGSYMNCGLKAKLLEIKGAKGIVEFTDISVRRELPVKCFYSKIASIFDGYSREFLGFKIGHVNFRLNSPSEVYYTCTCKKCGLVTVSRLVDLKNHTCESEIGGM